MICLLPCFCWYIYEIKDIWQKKLLIFSFTLTGALSITSIGNFIGSWTNLDSSSDTLPYGGYTILILFFITVLVLPFFRQLLKYYYLPIEKELSAKEGTYLSCLSFILFIILESGLSFIDYENLIQDPIILFLFWALILSVFIIYVLFFRMYFYTYMERIMQKKYLQIQYDMKLLEEEYRHINENIENNRRMKHDLKHYLLTIQGFLNGNEIEQAKQSIQQYVQNLQAYEMIRFCNNHVVNILISYYYALAKEKEINFIAHINITKELPIETPDISVLLGNLLENAIKATDFTGKKQRTIKLNILCHRKMLAITVDNDFNGNIRIDKNGNYLSTKLDHTGIGLKSIEDIAKKYNGSVEYSHDDKEFHSNIMLELSTQQKKT
jgi:signal transduction histidine kinase